MMGNTMVNDGYIIVDPAVNRPPIFDGNTSYLWLNEVTQAVV